MKQEWISKSKYMDMNHIGQTTMLKLMHEGKVEYQKIGKQYKIKVSENENINEENQKLLQRVTELETYIKTIQNTVNQVKV